MAIAQLRQPGTARMIDPLPLSGRTIVEHTHAGASPVALRAIALAGRIANDLGACVIQLSDAARSDRHWDAAADEFLNAGKLAAIDTPQSCQRADALLTSDPDGSSANLRIITPVRIIVSHGVPAHFGVPDAQVTDEMILALSGLLDLMGHPDQAPVPLGGKQASGVAGLAAFAGMMAALASGKPDIVRVSALETCLWSNWKSYAERLYMGRTPTRQGDRAEWQAVPCEDGFATFVYLEKDWPAICRMIGDPRLSTPPLDTQAGRRADMAAVYAIVNPWYCVRTRAELTAWSTATESEKRDIVARSRARQPSS